MLKSPKVPILEPEVLRKQETQKLRTDEEEIEELIGRRGAGLCMTCVMVPACVPCESWRRRYSRVDSKSSLNLVR